MCRRVKYWRQPEIFECQFYRGGTQTKEATVKYDAPGFGCLSMIDQTQLLKQQFPQHWRLFGKMLGIRIITHIIIIFTSSHFTSLVSCQQFLPGSDTEAETHRHHRRHHLH